MGSEPSALGTLVERLVALAERPFWQTASFWIEVVIGLAGLLFSILAFKEAKKAKTAATIAGRTVKIQTLTIELTELAQRLGTVQPGISFSQARDLLADVSRRIRRATSPFGRDDHFKPAIDVLKDTLLVAQDALKAVRPANVSSEQTAPEAVYYAVEGSFAALNDAVADLIGLFESHTFEYGDTDAKQ